MGKVAVAACLRQLQLAADKVAAVLPLQIKTEPAVPQIPVVVVVVVGLTLYLEDLTISAPADPVAPA